MGKNFTELKVGNWYRIPTVSDIPLLCVFKDDEGADFAHKSQCETIALNPQQLEQPDFTLTVRPAVTVIRTGPDNATIVMWYTDDILHIGQRKSDDDTFFLTFLRGERDFLLSSMQKMLAFKPYS